jgi:molybdate transport system permease protein
MNEAYLSPLWISLRTVAVATAITFVVGVAAARWMSRYSGRMGSLIEGLFLLPMVLPPTVVGLGLLLLFGKHGPMGAFLARFNTTVIFSWQATVISAAVMAFPIMYMTARGAFEQVDPSIEDAARTLGASEWRLFWTVTMPLAWPGVAAATVLSLARALGEFGATLMLAGNIPGKTATIPVAIYFAIQAGDMNRALVLVAIVVAIAFASLAAIAFWKGRALKVRHVVPARESTD